MSAASPADDIQYQQLPAHISEDVRVQHLETV
jgi:hypothetical protein